MLAMGRRCDFGRRCWAVRRSLGGPPAFASLTSLLSDMRLRLRLVRDRWKFRFAKERFDDMFGFRI